MARSAARHATGRLHADRGPAARTAPARDVHRAAGHPGENLFTPEEWVLLATNLRLTSRELSVAVLIFEGKTRADIAARLGLSVETVRTFIDRMHKKLRVKDRLGLALRIVRAHRLLAAAAGIAHVPLKGDLPLPAGAIE